MARSDKIDIPDIKRRPLNVPVKCGDCAFHRRLAVLPKPCSELGTPPSAEVCSRFVPDPKHFGDGEKLAKIFRTVSRIPKKALAAAALLGSRKTSRLGFNVGDRVAFRVTGDDYLNNYATGIVMGSTREQIVVAGRENFSALLYPTALLNEEQFEKKRARLIKADRINDPTGLKKIKIKDLTKLQVFVPELASGKKRRKAKAQEGKAKKTKVTRGVTRGGKTVHLSGV